MRIDEKDLPTKYQAQIAEKRLQNQREKAKKYHNTPDERSGADGRKIRFDSKREAARYDELMLLLKAGKIRDLKLQPQFTLQEAYTTPEGVHVRAIRYQADFSYERGHGMRYGDKWEAWETVVEDVKSRATKTRVYEMKKKLLRERWDIEIHEVE